MAPPGFPGAPQAPRAPGQAPTAPSSVTAKNVAKAAGKEVFGGLFSSGKDAATESLTPTAAAAAKGEKGGKGGLASGARGLAKSAVGNLSENPFSLSNVASNAAEKMIPESSLKQFKKTPTKNKGNAAWTNKGIDAKPVQNARGIATKEGNADSYKEAAYQGLRRGMYTGTKSTAKDAVKSGGDPISMGMRCCEHVTFGMAWGLKEKYGADNDPDGINLPHKAWKTDNGGPPKFTTKELAGTYVGNCPGSKMHFCEAPGGLCVCDTCFGIPIWLNYWMGPLKETGNWGKNAYMRLLFFDKYNFKDRDTVGIAGYDYADQYKREPRCDYHELAIVRPNTKKPNPTNRMT